MQVTKTDSRWTAARKELACTVETELVVLESVILELVVGVFAVDSGEAVDAVFRVVFWSRVELLERVTNTLISTGADPLAGEVHCTVAVVWLVIFCCPDRPLLQFTTGASHWPTEEFWELRACRRSEMPSSPLMVTL